MQLVKSLRFPERDAITGIDAHVRMNALGLY